MRLFMATTYLEVAASITEAGRAPIGDRRRSEPIEFQQLSFRGIGTCTFSARSALMNAALGLTGIHGVVDAPNCGQVSLFQYAESVDKRAQENSVPIC